MMRSMFAGVSGLRNHQIRMDVIGNNIANVNTVGYKAARASFRQLLSQTLRGASRPSQSRGGTNPMQVGLGVTLGSIDVLHGQGGLQTSGKVTHMAIQGNGFFVLRDASGVVYTRAGEFDLDADGYLVDPNGLRVQGWTATAGVFPTPTDTNLGDIQLRVGSPISAQATTSVTFGQNLDSATPNGNWYDVVVDVYDSLGNLHTLTVRFTKNDNGGTPDTEWDWSVTDADGAAVAGGGTIAFDPTGRVVSGGTGAINIAAHAGAAAMNITLDFNQLTQFASPTTATYLSRDGYPSGTLESFTVDDTGTITGVFSNGVSLPLARVALARFPNPGGLLHRGGGVFTESNNSGQRVIGVAGTAGLGTIAPGSLEMSNVDLAQEFTDMIVTQRGFQANARIIGASDEMLQELVNLRR